MSTSDEQIDQGPKIIIRPNGPYKVLGGIPLVRKVQIVSEHGEPLAWKKEETIPTDETYTLCRCGRSGDKPFCDRTHRTIDFDGAETADIRPTAERQRTYPGSTHIVVKHDDSLCAESGFCATRLATIAQLVRNTGDTGVRAQVIGMVERCPSGSLTYSVEPGGPDIEPDLPCQVAVTTEITDQGPIAGPLWVTGNVVIERADDRPFETRNRVALCCCGLSKNKPLCDGTHRTAAARPG
jgi:CDGSH-type Zn-finger protein